MNSSRLLLCVGFVSLLLGGAGCSHQVTLLALPAPAAPDASAAQVAHPAISFSLKGPAVSQPTQPQPQPWLANPARPDHLEEQDRPIVDARHGWSYASPR